MSKHRLINGNYIFVQAYNLYCKAKKAEQHDYIRALNLYRQSLALIDSILERFPASALALRIAQRKFRIGQSTYAGVLKKVAKLKECAWRQELLEILLDCARNISRGRIRCEKLADLAKLFMLNNQKDRAVAVVSEAAEMAEYIEDAATRNHVLSFLAVKYADIGEYERALTLSAFFSDKMDQIRLLTSLGVMYYEKKMRDRARQLFISVIDILENTPEKEIRLTGTAWTAYKLAESGEYYWAFEVAETIEDQESRLAVMHQVVEHLIGSGKYVNISEIARKIDNPAIQAELSVSLVIKHSADGFFSQAREAAASISIPFLRARALLAIAAEHKDRSVTAVACELINDALKQVDQIVAIPEKILVLTQSAAALYKLRQEASVQDSMKRAFNLLSTLTNAQQRSEYVIFLLKNCLEFGQLEMANEMLNQISDTAAKNLAIIEVAARHALLDNFALARQLATSIKDPLCRFQGYLRIVAANPENRNYRDKLQLLNEVAAAQGLPLEATDQVLAECTILLAKAERFHSALQLQEKISEGSRDELLWRLAVIKFNSDQLEEGVEVIRLIKDPDRRIARMIELGVAIFNGEYPNATFTAGDFMPVAFSFWLDEKEKLEAAQ
ncbi:MAG: hypothetical protein CVV41_16745 [Candidatus Riflebacteria bacterium HGW-Riflebacteria-1]|jgi:tetratricopeptide (TPR) repeat protein|nr:MAG: hypothetical protein CVV41_16745 [Candidatus Riflebacteria bacterium HGW-Riflebacteria-1]